MVVLPLLAGGCARSDLGRRAAQDIVNKDVTAKVKGTTKGIEKVEGQTLSFLGSNPTTGAPLWKLSAAKLTTQEAGDGGLPRRGSLEQGVVQLYRNGQLESTFTAPLIEFSKGETGLRLSMPRGVNASDAGALVKSNDKINDKIGAENKVTISASAPRGDIDVNKRLVTLSGGARVVRGPITVTGQTLKTQTDLGRSTMNGAVVATSSQGTTRADSAIFAWKTNRMSAQKVTFVGKDVTLSGAKIEADTALNKGTLSGDVRARNHNGASARAPRAAFDWKADQISAPDATFARAGATMRAARIVTDSHLKLARAGDVVASQDGAILRAASAQGFDGLGTLRGQGVRIERAGATLRAASADARDWSKPSGVVSGNEVTIAREGTTLRAAQGTARDWSKNGGTFEGTGGVTVTNARGSARADSATWTGGKDGHIEARGNVEIRSDGSVLRGARGNSDAAFRDATMSGDVRADLKDGNTVRAPQVRKSGDKIVATGGAVAQLKTAGELGLLTLRAPRVETTISGQRALASGGVKMKSAEGATASADRATYERATRKVTATGNVVYNDPKKGLSSSGSSLQADLKLQSAVILGARGQSSEKLFDGKPLFG